MPSLSLKTNVKIADPKAFSLEFSKFGAEVLGKPEGYITVDYTYNETMTFAGTHEPAFTLTIISLGNLAPHQTEKYSATISKFLKEKLGLESDRGYILFQDPGNANLGFKGTTFATIFGPN